MYDLCSIHVTYMHASATTPVCPLLRHVPRYRHEPVSSSESIDSCFLTLLCSSTSDWVWTPGNSSSSLGQCVNDVPELLCPVCIGLNSNSNDLLFERWTNESISKRSPNFITTTRWLLSCRLKQLIYNQMNLQFNYNHRWWYLILHMNDVIVI